MNNFNVDLPHKVLRDWDIVQETMRWKGGDKMAIVDLNNVPRKRLLDLIVGQVPKPIHLNGTWYSMCTDRRSSNHFRPRKCDFPVLLFFVELLNVFNVCK